MQEREFDGHKKNYLVSFPKWQQFTVVKICVVVKQNFEQQIGLEGSDSAKYNGKKMTEIKSPGNSQLVRTWK